MQRFLMLCAIAALATTAGAQELTVRRVGAPPIYIDVEPRYRWHVPRVEVHQPRDLSEILRSDPTPAPVHRGGSIDWQAADRAKKQFDEWLARPLGTTGGLSKTETPHPAPDAREEELLGVIEALVSRVEELEGRLLQLEGVPK